MGTVRSRGDRHQGIVRVTGHEPQYKSFDSKREAKAWVRETEQALSSTLVTNPDIKIVDLIDRYVKEIAPKRKMAPSHLSHDIPSIRRVFEDMTMRDLTGRGLTDWVLNQKQHASTRNWHVARLCGVLRQAESHWEVVVPWTDMKRCRDRMWELGYLALPNERDRRVSDSELDAIKNSIPPNTRIAAKDIFDFCVATAMRIAEVCRIEWKDLDREARTIIVRDRKHPRKKYGNHQVVPLLNGSFDILDAQPKKHERIFKCVSTAPSRVFKAAADKAKLEDIVLHDLRHEGISRMFELGFEIQEVALVSGHTNWRTLRRYTHLRPASLVEKEKRLRRLMEADRQGLT